MPSHATATSRDSAILAAEAPSRASNAVGRQIDAGRWRKLLRHEWMVTASLVLLDTLAWIALSTLATLIRYSFYVTPMQFVLVHLLQLAMIIAALTIVSGYSRHTDVRSLPYATEHVLAISSAAALSAVAVFAAATFDQSIKPSRATFLISFAAFLVVSLVYRRFIWSFVSASTATRAFLVVGSGELALLFYLAYRKSVNRQRLEFVDVGHGLVGQHIAGPGSPIIEGDLTTKLERLDERYSGVVLAERIDRLRPELLDQLVRTQFNRTRVYTLESFHEAYWRYVPVQSLDPFWPLQTGFQLARNSPYHYVKKLFDMVLAGALLIVLSPLIVAIVILIWSQNGRPAIFKQTRVGRDDAQFTVYKFRTMFSRSDETETDIYTRRDDPRITPLGKWLRKLRLDELPQLWNVLKGEMSLIGPRAEWIKCAERYEKKIPFYHFRHLVKPGITGWAQVNYGYGESDEDAIEKLKFDLYYIRNYSLKLDLMIVLKTVHTVLFGKGQ